jgi:hypothetical protein
VLNIAFDDGSYLDDADAVVARSSRNQWQLALRSMLAAFDTREGIMNCATPSLCQTLDAPVG